MKTRKEAVAGAFYPYGAVELETLIKSLIGEKDDPDIPAPKAIIVPHAGYIFSGSIAASAYRKIKSCQGYIKRAVIFGPCHRTAFNGIALSSADKWSTPIGDVNVDKKACEALDELDFINYNDDAHTDEHSLEVQVPFLKQIFHNIEIIPMLACMTSLTEAVQALEKVWGEEETLIIISADLSHFLTYEEAQERDNATVRAIENLDYSSLENDDTCGLIPISALLEIANRKKMKVKTFDVKCSGDTAGRKESVVGYASFGFWEII